VSLVALALFAGGCARAPSAAAVAATPEFPLQAVTTPVARAPATATATATAKPTAMLVKASAAPKPVRSLVAAVSVPIARPRRTSLPARPESQIYSVSASPSVVHDGQAVVWDVRTTPDIVSVTATTTMIALPLQRFSPGHFGLTFAIPRGVPGFFHGTYNMDVSAVSAHGATLHRGIALTFL
jgi:PBP1b-binding outer membrane lipoprotein LpoB